MGISNSQQGMSNFQGAWVDTSFLTANRADFANGRLGLWVRFLTAKDAKDAKEDLGCGLG
jgi:hypothetical protein